ncbi:tripartite tricarboxylate transporter substrate binding protein [uncultured Serinicoccus sp.]|uniref:tripartite tricarboxylate transporter substrate binding protein n=1 Tax=uncultured Serinicoccus sp. TaxID=735514 RepID=UPI002636E286|nr:tripartite tricarboxylate transporter substrate binding protein [uncultured Serinicoccus sp.]
MTVIVPYDAGGNGDTMARAIAPCLSDETGASFVVENVPGAGGTIGTRRLVEAEPDGYTVSISSNSPTVITPVTTDTGYEFDDMEVVALMYATPMILWVAGDSDIETFEDFAEASSSEEATIATPGANSLQDFATRALVEDGAFEARVVPTDSNAEIARGVLAGDYSAGATAVSLDYLPRIESGEMRVIAVAGDSVPSYLPGETQTLEELGYGDALPSMSIEVPVVVPAGTPEDVQDRLTDLWRTCLDEPDVQEGVGPFLPETFRDPDEVTDEYKELEEAIREVVG